MEPTAAVSAAADPDTPAKNMDDTTETTARPPGRCPTSVSASRTMRCEMPPRAHKLPGCHEERYGQQGKAVGPGVQPLNRHHGVHASLDEQRGEGRGTHRQHDGGVAGEEQAQHPEEHQRGHGRSPVGEGVSDAWSARPSSPPPCRSPVACLASIASTCSMDSAPPTGKGNAGMSRDRPSAGVD